MNRDSVPDVPWGVPERPCQPLAKGLQRNGGKTRFTRRNVADFRALRALQDGSAGRESIGD